jgi:hypothetical protein
MDLDCVSQYAKTNPPDMPFDWTQTYYWEAPVPYPSTGGPYTWDEATQSWVTVA